MMDSTDNTRQLIVGYVVITVWLLGFLVHLWLDNN